MSDLVTQRFHVVLATDGDVDPSEIGEILEAVGYHGVTVLDQADVPNHECPCPSNGCIDRLREAGRTIDDVVKCCICWTHAGA